MCTAPRPRFHVHLWWTGNSLVHPHGWELCFFFSLCHKAWVLIFLFQLSCNDVLRVVFNKHNRGFISITWVSQMVKLCRISADVTCCAVFVVSLKWRNPAQCGMLQRNRVVTVSGLNQSCFQAELYSHWSVHRRRRLIHAPFSPPPSFPLSYSLC